MEEGRSRLPRKASFQVLVVDDARATRQLLRRMLEAEGYTVIEATNGLECLSMYRQHLPDLVLLDAVIPAPNGFESCRRLRELYPNDQIPILMVTSLNDTGSVDKAFEMGATDYITKPIHLSILRNRVRRLLAHRQAERMQSALTHMIVHDMKTPLSVAIGYSDLLLIEREILSENQQKIVERIKSNCQSLLDMTWQILDIDRLKAGKLELNRQEEAIQAMLLDAIKTVQLLAEIKEITLQLICDNPALTLNCDRQLMTRVLTNLLTNAIKYSPNARTVTLSALRSTDPFKPGWYLVVKDEGAGIAPEDQIRIFDRYTQASRRKDDYSGDSGLGLTFCKLAVEAHGGKIGVESKINRGSAFTVFLPD
jgi:two-component system, sensor histidine kinase and response regulator